MIILDVEQGSEDWFKARVGVPSASIFDKIVIRRESLCASQLHRRAFFCGGHYD